ncbi:MAG: 16S rRNA (cytosine(1402)-N(4))-methyltransferase [Gammaproteobacteria bacterium]|nr:16S rRNA (cytosine(1402)-N(4))-methyltransferase [Gammaproteobacteria bacterium]MAY02294.1 16S rRNA (cytosine(1402)-N(4))-methyltransferase [Gammaproteobacteria bacterium]|tara:strand:- start:94 stop:1023 length:930 start_codon:yes stop_codon:yes gene_type:complete
MDKQHQSVLLEQAVQALLGDKDGFYIDATFGRGGHSKRILAGLSEHGRLLVIDKDPEAVAMARRIAEQDKRLSVHHGSYTALAELVEALGMKGQVAGVLMDLGVSSPQLDDPLRGFSFMQDGPLDMRMNTTAGISAKDWLAQADERSIADVLYQFGEERYSRRIAAAIVRQRQEKQISSTLELAEIIKTAHPRWEKNKHPATRSFQAIRIFVNSELEDLRRTLPDILEVLAIGGRLVVISFHSLEDRIVKRFIQDEVRGDDFPADLPIRQEELKPRLKHIGKAVKASAEELTENIRARSAVMRTAEKIA